MASKREVLLAAVCPVEVVEVPELGVAFTIRGMTGTQRDAYEMSLTAPTANGRKRVPELSNVRAKLLIRCLVDDETLEPIFTDNDIADLGKVDARVLVQLFEVAQRLSGLSPKDMEELEKNSATPKASSDSPSDLRVN